MNEMTAPQRVAAFDEMLGTTQEVTDPYRTLDAWLSQQSLSDLAAKRDEAEALFRRAGITFSVYSDASASERLIPFDVLPRILSAAEWRRLSRGIEQRVRALNAFIYDVYHRQEIIRAGRIPEDLILYNKAFLPQMVGVNPRGGVYAHIMGIDIVRTSADDFVVLEDNTRTPSGVSYMLENRETMMQLFPDLFSRHRVAPIEHYSESLRATLESVAPSSLTEPPEIVVLTPGVYNSAYFEHAFLADQMGVELVEARDLVVEDGQLFMATTLGHKQVDVVYRRLDDDYLDPLNFRPDSLIGVPGLFDLYRAGRVTIANAPGAGIADDKAIYRYIPEIIEFYTGRSPILKNVPTYNCRDQSDQKYVLEHLEELVIKQVHGSGGFGMMIGPKASRDEIDIFRLKIKARPEQYVAQPTLALSTCPTLVDEGIAHLRRPFNAAVESRARGTVHQLLNHS